VHYPRALCHLYVASFDKSSKSDSSFGMQGLISQGKRQEVSRAILNINFLKPMRKRAAKIIPDA
jgi:hypothetical protein